jgi:hypothetical protein
MISWGMVEVVLVGFIWVHLVWFVICNMCEACVHDYWFGYKWNACELSWFWLQVGCL